jgi:glutaconate CoA-transferase subunit B
MAVFDFEKDLGRFRLRSVHPPFTAADIRAQTGFDYDEPARVPATPQPDTATLALVRGRIIDELAETYPAFASSMMERRSDAATPAGRS